MKILTADPIDLPPAAKDAASLPEFGRWREVEKRFGIKRGTLYNLMAEGKIKSVVVRRKGNRHGCRVFYLESIRQYLHSLLET